MQANQIDFSAKQRQVWVNTIENHHRWNISYGATRSGKTYLDYYKIPYRIRHANKEGLILLLGNTKGTLERNILDPMRSMWTDRLVGHIGSNNKVQLFGRECYALGADKISQVERLQGAGFQYVYGDEVTTWHPDVFQMLKSRLDKPNSCFDGTCNPDNPKHWFKGFLESDADIYSMKFTIDDNPFLNPAVVEALKKEYAGTIYEKRFINGEWALADGLVYDLFDPDKHTTDFVPGGGTYYISVDYGTVNPFAAGLFCVSGQKAEMVQEYYYAGGENTVRKTDEEYYDEIEKLAAGKQVSGIIVDPSAASFIECIRRHGRFSVIKGDNSVMDGIRNTAAMLNCGMLVIHRSCTNIITEFAQ